MSAETIPNAGAVVEQPNALAGVVDEKTVVPDAQAASADDEGEAAQDDPEADGDKQEGQQKSGRRRNGWQRQQLKIERMASENGALRRELELLRQQQGTPTTKAEAKANAEQRGGLEPGEPDIADFETISDYNKAHYRWLKEQDQKAQQQETAQREQAAQREKESTRAQQMLERGLEKYGDDFLDAVQGQSREFTQLCADRAVYEAILESESGADIWYHLEANPNEAARIAALPRARKLAEIVKLEDRFASEAAGKPKAQELPKPITGSRGDKGSGVAATKNPATMSQKEFEQFLKSPAARTYRLGGW